MKKRIIVFVLLISLIVSQMSLIPIQGLFANDKEEQYVIISETSEGYNVTKDTLTLEEANFVRMRNGIIVIEEDGVVTGCSVKNNIFDKEEHEKKVNKNLSPENWNKKIINSSSDKYSVSGPAIKIALIDSGVNYDPNINVVERKNFIEYDEDVSYLYEDISGHGTSIAGIIGSKEYYINDIIGINPNVEIYSARVLDKDLEAPISRVVEAIYWAISKGVNILSISFGTNDNSEALKVAIQDAYNAGILIIASAGNNSEVVYPAAYDQVMAVGSVNPEGDSSYFSPKSNKIEIVAPGENITSSAAFSGKMAGCSGTSMSVPHIVGVASVLWQKDTSRSADFIRKLVDYSANLYGDSKLYGNGLVDLDYALKIYDDFSQIYTQDNFITDISNAEEAGIISNNSSEIDIRNVVGNWEYDGHRYLVSSNYNNAWSTQRYNAFMYGCTYADTVSSELKGISQFHGQLWSSANDSNYISCYIFLTQAAQMLYAANVTVGGDSTVSIPGLFSTDTTALKGVIKYDPYTGTGSVKNVSWATICSNAGVSNSSENRSAFVYGMALHAATDAIAHCSWRYSASTNTWYKNIHSSDDDGDGTANADDTDYYPARYNAAGFVATKIINRCGSSTSNAQQGDLSDFIIPKSYYDQGYSSANQSQDFLLGNFRYYASLTGSSSYSSNLSIIRHGDLYYQCSTYSNNYVFTYDGYSHTAQ
jgi:minor extracellular protease Epr